MATNLTFLKHLLADSYAYESTSDTTLTVTFINGSSFDVKYANPPDCIS